MRVERTCEGIHEALEDVVVIYLVKAPEKAFVTLLQSLLRLFPGLIFDGEIQGVVLDSLAPDFVEFRRGLGPRLLGTVELVALVHGKIGFGIELLQRERQSFPDAGLVELIQVEDRIERPAAHHVVELVAVVLEELDITGQQIHAIAIE